MTHTWEADGVEWEDTRIKIPNDGFCYKPESSFRTTATNIQHHNSSTYSRLDHAEVRDPFESVWLFADWYFGDPNWGSEVLYNFLEERIDVIIVHDTLPLKLSINWELGYQSAGRSLITGSETPRKPLTQ